MIETTIQDPERHETIRADSQGRINLGVEYAGRSVEVVVVGSENPTEGKGVQQTITDRSLPPAERTGMLFVRTFGVAERCLVEDHTATVGEEGVEAETVSPDDVDLAGTLVDSRNIAQFVPDPDAAAGVMSDLTAEPVTVEAADDDYAEPVYYYENPAGELSAVAQEYVAKVGRALGYDPTEALENVRVHPENGDHPVRFEDSASDAYIAVAPYIADA